MEQKSRSKSVVATISALAVGATMVGGGLAWWKIAHDRPQTNIPSKISSPAPVTVDPARVDQQTVAPIAIPPNPIAVPPPVTSRIPQVIQKTTLTPSVVQKQENTVKIWRLDDDGKKTILVPQERQDPQASTTDPEVRLNRSISSLIASAGKPDGNLTSTIPVGTKLLSAKILADGVHVDLSKEFTQGFGATSMIGRLGQVVYTATTQNPDAPVWITVEGKKLEVLGDVGVEIRQPITRQTYNQDFPINPGASTTP